MQLLPLLPRSGYIHGFVRCGHFGRGPSEVTFAMMDGLALVQSRELLYQDEVGGDACGIGGVAAKDGKPSAEVVQKAVLALKCLEHRGGVCQDAGDGAGVTTQIPQAFFRRRTPPLTMLLSSPAAYTAWKPRSARRSSSRRWTSGNVGMACLPRCAASSFTA